MSGHKQVGLQTMLTERQTVLFGTLIAQTVPLSRPFCIDFLDPWVFPQCVFDGRLKFVDGCYVTEWNVRL